MSRFRMLRFAAISWLPLFSLVAGAQAQTHLSYNVASDWLSTYSNSAAVASAGVTNGGTWAPVGQSGVWSAGELSWNWTNVSATGGTIAQGTENVTTYYNPSTGYISGVATYTYTVPFAAYRFAPGATIMEKVGQTITSVIENKVISVAGSSITRPTGISIPGATTALAAASGIFQTTAAVEKVTSASSAIGFSTTALSVQTGTFKDGQSGNSVQDVTPGVFFNYGANATSTQLAALNLASGTVNNMVELFGALGPTYVAWTAPSAGFVNISLSAYNLQESTSDNDGNPGFYVLTSTGGPTAPLLSASPYATPPGGASSAFTANMSAAAGYGTPTALGSLAGFSGSYGLSWVSGTFAVTNGETIYFVADPNHTEGGQHAFEGGMDPIALKDAISFTPEPSSFLLMGMAGVGLALAAWRRRRAAA
jgi:hypothetical protein